MDLNGRNFGDESEGWGKGMGRGKEKTAERGENTTEINLCLRPFVNHHKKKNTELTVHTI